MSLFICYIPGMDLRRINTKNTPYINGLLNSYSWAKIRTFPSTELVPTLLTGVYPHGHGIWQVKLKSNQIPCLRHILADKIPDILTTTFQCVIQFFNPFLEGLAAIPFRRLRHFQIKRFKYTKRMRSSEILLRIGGVESIFSIVGNRKSNYIFTKQVSKLNELLYKICSGVFKLEFLELYSLDLFQHWNLDNNSKVTKFYRYIDTFVESIHRKCQYNGIKLVLLSDHGQEQVKNIINIQRELKRLNLSEDEYNFFIEVPMARFWFHTERARRKIIDMLASIDNGTVLSYKDMHQYNIKFEDDTYGEIYFIADSGYIIFPHDFYQPLANMFLGLTDWKQRNRIFNPKHRGCHGYLPQYESEKGFIIILDSNYRIYEQEINIIDVAPSILALLGYKKPDFMKGNCIFYT